MQIGYDCPVQGSDTVEADVARLKRSKALARAAAEAQADAERLVAEAQSQQHGIGSAIKKAGRLLDRVFGGLLEWIATVEDEAAARQEVQTALAGAETLAREHVKAALRETRKALEAKTQAQGVFRWTDIEERPDPANPGKTITVRIPHEKPWQHPWYGKQVKFQGQPRLDLATNPDGKTVVMGTWDYEVAGPP